MLLVRLFGFENVNLSFVLECAVKIIRQIIQSVRNSIADKDADRSLVSASVTV